MASASIKDPIMMSYPKTLLSIVLYVGGLAVFLVFASTFLVSQPIGDAVTGYFYGVDHTQRIDLVTSVNKSADYSSIDSNVVNGTEAIVDNRSKFDGVDDVKGNELDGLDDVKGNELDGLDDVKGNERGKKNGTFESLDMNQFSEPVKGDGGDGSVNSSSLASSRNSNVQTNHKNGSRVSPYGDKEDVTSRVPAKTSEADSIDSECDLYHGKWIYDSAGPLYTNGSCPVLTQMQNCQGNGRPDKDYENWRWKPTRCDLPRFDARKFLELMRGKTLAYIGDSVARNQMESMLCILWQVEVPKNRGNKKMQRYFFRSTSTMIVRIWSSWLVHQTSEPFDFAPAGVTKLHLDAPDEGFMDSIMDFDVIVLSSGHWFAKQSVYILNNEIVGGQLWWPDKSREQKVNNIEAFAISVETILSALVTHPNYTGLTIVRSFSPDHYEGGAWNTGGSCTGKVKPATDTELFQNGFTNIMHEKQVTGFNRAIKKKTNKSQLKLMDITQVFQYRHDGHPGPYRSPDPNKITKRGPDGKPPPQDCLHWCMPGPVDTWNEMVSETIRREFEDRKIPS